VREVRDSSSIGSYDNHVTTPGPGPSGPPATAPGASATASGPPATGTRRVIDLDPRSALAVALAFAALAVTVWLVRSIPKTLTALAIATLIALALNPLVERVRRRTGWSRRPAAVAVLLGVAVLGAVAATLVVVPTIQQARSIRDDIPRTVDDLGDLPVIGPRLRDADAANNVEKWLNELPERLSVDATPVERAATSIADGLASALLTVLLAIALVLDGEDIVRRARHLVPPARRPHADRIGSLVYEVIGRYVAGSLFVAVLAGIVMLTSAIVLSVPLAPIIGVWVAITNPIPQLGGLLGAVPFVLLGFTVSAVVGVVCLVIFVVYQNLENHVIHPLIVGRAVHLSPPATMVAALVGVSAGGVIGALFAVPLLGASKAVYLALRGEQPDDAPAPVPEPAAN